MKRIFLDEKTESMFNKIRVTHSAVLIGGHTSYYRSMAEPCTISAEKCDEQNMKMLGLSVYNPIYLIGKIKRYIKEGLSFFK